MADWVSKYELGELVGKDNAETLCRMYGGIEVWIPKNIDEKHALAPLVGVEPLLRLSEAYGGTQVVFPNERMERNTQAAILKGLQEGKSVTAIALELGITTRWVYAVASKNNVPTAQKQLSLFS